MDDISNKCLYHKISRNQRKNELSRGLDEKGTIGFEDRGCYECSGFNNKCPVYFSPNLLKEKYSKKSQ